MLNWIRTHVSSPNYKNTSTKARSFKRPFFFSNQGSLACRRGHSYEEGCQEGYGKNIIVYRAINMVAHNLAGVDWLLPKNYENENLSQWQRLLQKPNPLQSWSGFMETLVSYLLISGNSYVEAITNEEGEVAELYCLRPDRLTIRPGPYGLPKGYEYRVENQTRFIPVDQRSGASSLLHIKLFHPQNDWYGLSPLQSAALAIDQYNAVGEHNLRLLQNGGRPSGALIMKPSDSTLPMNEHQREEMRQALQEAYGGAAGAGKMMVLEGDMDWREMGLSPKDLDFLSGQYLSAREISQAFGVPPMLVGVPGDATFANYKEARFHLWEDTLIPLLKRIQGDFSNWLLGSYDAQKKPSTGFHFDPESIPALRVRRDSLWERLAQADFLTPNEKRNALGYGPLEKTSTVPQSSFSEDGANQRPLEPYNINDKR